MNIKDFQKFLNFMFQMGIINNIEYNNLYNKSLPYLKK